MPDWVVPDWVVPSCSYDPKVPTPVLATKIFAPTRRTSLVARPRLLRQLDGTLEAGHRLALVSAPAGFGKTTLLGDWLGHLDQREPPPRVGWLSLDEGDNDLARLLTHALAALRGAGLDVDPAVLESLHTASTPAALTALVNAVAQAGESAPGTQWVLVLDDYHAIDAPEVHEAVVFLLDRLPEHLRLLVATRADPPLPLARLRSRGQLTEVRAADLRFTAAEALDFLTQAMGLDLTVADVEALEERTEGWVAGLQLAALSLRGIPERGEVAGFIAAFTGSNRFVIDYLADEVLARQPAEVTEFLLRTAVLDRLTGSLCDAVTGRADGARLLEDLERDNLFLVPLDTHRSWYRYHHLFADVLHARLLAHHPAEVAGLHQRASSWYAEHDLTEDAVRHSLSAGDFERAGYLMEQAVPELRRTRQDGVLIAWVGSLPDSVVRRSPVLGILSGWSRMMSGDLAGLESRLDDAEAALASGADDPALAAAWADTEDLRIAPALIQVYRASLAQARGDVAGTRRHASRAYDLAEAEDHFVRGAAAGFLGLAAWAAGEVQEARATFSEGVRSLHAAGNLVDELDSTVVLADLWVASGRPSRARLLYQEALETATAAGEPYPRATADLHVGLAELDRELDDLASAEEHLETARVLAERGSITENRHRWFVAMALLHSARGEYDAAARLLDRAGELYRHGFYPDVRPIAAMRARLDLAAGDLDRAVGWAHDRGVSVDDDPDYLREYEHLTLARLLLAQHRAGHPSGAGSPSPSAPSPAAAALGLLDRLHTAATDAGRDGSVLEIRALQALAHDAQGDRTRALATLERALAETPEPDGHARLFLDEGAPLTALLNLVWDRRSGGPTPPGQPLADPLSRRELDVLRRLDGELTGPEIARELYVSLNTFRTHTKRIFTKLDVTTRAAAVRRARELGLL